MGVLILDLEGKLICRGEASVAGDGRLALALSPGARGRLFDYYFFRHGRRVVLASDDANLLCDLRTTWGGTQRLWWLRPLPVSPSAAASGALTA